MLSSSVTAAAKFASMLQDTCDQMCQTDDSFVSVQTVKPIPIFCNRVLRGSYVQKPWTQYV